MTGDLYALSFVSTSSIQLHSWDHEIAAVFDMVGLPCRYWKCWGTQKSIMLASKKPWLEIFHFLLQTHYHKVLKWPLTSPFQDDIKIHLLYSYILIIERTKPNKKILPVSWEGDPDIVILFCLVWIKHSAVMVIHHGGSPDDNADNLASSDYFTTYA